MQQRDVHLSRQRAGIKLINHFHRGSGVSRQRQQVDIAAINQSKRNGRMAQAIQRAVGAVWPRFDTELLQDPVERPAHDVQHQPRNF